MIILVYHLFIGMKKYKKNTILMHQHTDENASSIDRLEENSLNLESIQHITKAFPCITGAFFILFHLILFFRIIIRLFLTQNELIQPMILFIINVSILYQLPKSIIKAFNKLCSNQSSKNAHTLKYTIIDVFSILVFFFTIITSKLFLYKECK